METNAVPNIIDLIDPWRNPDALLPAGLQARIRVAQNAARSLQHAVDAFTDEHASVFRDYAAAVAARRDVPEDAWETLDRESGYVALWINVLATEAMLGAVLEVPPPTLITPPGGDNWAT